nr:MAG TPA: hypothetical protein [Caudoviricetes sp.]
MSRLFLFALLNTLIEPGEGTYPCGIITTSYTSTEGESP